MKKFILIALLVITLVLPSFCFAADAAHAVAVSGDIAQVVGIADGSSGAMTEVSSTSGALNTAGRAQAVTRSSSDGLIYTGACRVQSFVITGVSAGDVALIYDAATATGTPIFDIKVGTAVDTKVIPCYGAPFSTGIYVDATDADVITTAIYDY